MSTNLGQEIVQKLDSKVPYQQVAKEYSWSSLSLADRQYLWQEARRRSADGHNALLFAIYTMTREQHPWDELHALALIVELPDTVMPLAKKQDGLKRMSGRLEYIRGTLSDQNPADIQRYRQYKAGYYVLEAKTSLRLKNIARATRNYQEALAIYQEYGLEERASRVRQEIARLKKMEEEGQHLLPLDRLASEQLRLQEELTKIRASVTAQQQQLSEIQASYQKAKRGRDGLLQEVRDKKPQIQKLDQEYKKQQALRQKLEEDIEKKLPALNFLVALPQAAMAPLWVEVVRLALEQGEIDELTRQALERLALDFPEEAVPLLAEIAARSPEPFTVNAQDFQSKVTRGLALMADARQLKEKQQDLSAAAKVLVEAWNLLLASGETDE